ncbi:amidase signature enzyme [Roridomyces roridus]|uniref:Amidase signature enzyme n=1 Tax=Roridomyces roridus TaxID=1738132 RepID=A0AAD7BRN6_9AGAR|nr:amidase signature enzyme [Roridomyces roridus]
MLPEAKWNASDKARLGGALRQPSTPPTTKRSTPRLFALLLLVCLILAQIFHVFSSGTSRKVLPDLYEASVLELQAGLDAGVFTSVDLVRAYFARIEEVNIDGPGLRAVIEVSPSALKEAAILDAERKRSGRRSLLHGIPVLLKDNIATSDGMNTTAGSYSLLGSIVPEDAGVVKKLRAAGAIILGKANLSEFSQARSQTLPVGWSGRGGQTTNAYFPRANACGSSSGSGVAASIGLAAITLGSETDGSITCPSAVNNIAGIKPTLGLTSRAGVIPISMHQDTIGPMTRSIADGAIVLSIIAGPDPNDNFTLAQPAVVPDFTQALKKDALKGRRIGVPRRVFMNNSITGNDPSINIAFERALLTLKELGATIVDPADLPSAEEFSNRTYVVTRADMKYQLNEYFQALLENPSGVRSVADLIRFNDDHPELEKPEGFEDQTSLINMNASNGFDAEYFAGRARNHDMGSTRGIDFVLNQFGLDALVSPSAFVTTPAAVVGYPLVTVPLGFHPENVTMIPMGDTVYPAPGMPFGLTFWGTKFTDFELIGFAYAYEQKTQTRLKRRAYPAAIPKTQLGDVM